MAKRSSKYMKIPAEDRTKEIFLMLYDYLDGYRPQIHKSLSKNSLNGRCTSSLRLFMREQIKDMKLSVDKDLCIGCGLCAEKCPVEAIQMENNWPVWKLEKCEMCLGCLYRCPKFAISKS